MPDVKITRQSDTETTPSSAPARDREFEAIRQRAYELFLDRGGHHSNEVDDWLAAEREILGMASGAVLEQDGAYDVDVSLPGFSAGDVEIMATDTEVVVHAMMTATEISTEKDSALIETRENEVYRRFRLPTPISFERISAEFNDGVLHVHAPKSKAVTRAELATA
jgi:HSP20 family molecular chaperone IbpA